MALSRWLGAAVAMGIALWIGRKTAQKLPEALPPVAAAQLKQDFPAVAQLLFDMGKASEKVKDQSARPGLNFNGTKRHPIVIVPGIISCGLEVWKAKPCLGDGHFRRRVWGDFAMAEAVLMNWTCWLEHLTLDPVSGMDKEGVRVRASSGLKSADYFIGTYWLWAKLIQALADIGYEERDIHLACYDWRLAYSVLEQRDRYFSLLQHQIEGMLAATGEKAVIIPHSMGSLVAHYFLNFVESQSPGWVDKHVHAIVSLGGAYLGAMGPLAAYLSGEMDATAGLGPVGNYVEKLAVTWDEIRDMYWSFGGLASLLPKGGSAVWGSSATGFTDTPADVVEVPEDMQLQMSADVSLEGMFQYVTKHQHPLGDYVSFHAYDHMARLPVPNETLSQKYYANPLASPLPNAPDLKIYCIYGVGLPTERAYKYALRQVRWAFADADSLSGSMWSSTKSVNAVVAELRTYLGSDMAEKAVLLDAGVQRIVWPRVREAAEYLEELAANVQNPEQWMRINHSFSSTGDGPWGNGLDGVYSSGVAKTDGDGTVPLASLGYMCAHGWRDFPALNPAKIPTVVKEVKHEPCSLLEDPRGGPKTAKHVEIIGNSEVITDILHIVSGSNGHDLQHDRIISNLSAWGPTISRRLQEHLGSHQAKA